MILARWQSVTACTVSFISRLFSILCCVTHLDTFNVSVVLVITVLNSDSLSLPQFSVQIHSPIRWAMKSGHVNSQNESCFHLQVLCQVLNRVSSQTSCFQHVITLDIPELKSVDHFPILTAVMGVLLALLLDDM
jgi:hypothetical protein